MNESRRIETCSRSDLGFGCECWWLLANWATAFSIHVIYRFRITDGREKNMGRKNWSEHSNYYSVSEDAVVERAFANVLIILIYVKKSIRCWAHTQTHKPTLNMTHEQFYASNTDSRLVPAKDIWTIFYTYNWGFGFLLRLLAHFFKPWIFGFSFFFSSILFGNASVRNVRWVSVLKLIQIFSLPLSFFWGDLRITSDS